MAKIIIIDGNRYALPEGISNKDVQSLAGFLVTLTKVDYEYLWDDASTYAHYLSRGAEVRIEEADLISKEEARARGRKGKEAHDAKKAASTEA